MEKKIKLMVPEEFPRTRLDHYLIQSGIPLSRSRIQKLIRDKLIQVVGKGVKPNFILKGGEEIIIEMPTEREIILEAEDIELDVRYEDDYFVIVNKPPGMVTHPARGHYSGTLVNAILSHTLTISPVGGDFRPGIVHRLDRNTSGLLIIAKTEQAHLKIAEEIAQREVKKYYRAIIWGHPDRHLGVINEPIGHNPKDHKKMGVISDGKPSITEYTARAYYDFLTDVEIRLHTGRTHQIRVHFAHIGHNVFGDPEYGGRIERLGGIAQEHRVFAKKLLDLIDRQALHAERLEFDHPMTGEHIDVSCPLPQDMQTVIDVLTVKSLS